MGLLIQEVRVNRTEGHRCGDSAVSESCFDTPGEVFRFCQREYGHCVSSVYVDKDKKTMRIGWVFQKRRRYDDCNESYLAETWVTLHEKKPETTVTKFWMNIDKGRSDDRQTNDG